MIGWQPYLILLILLRTAAKAGDQEFPLREHSQKR
jgi:hypothetical protein